MQPTPLDSKVDRPEIKPAYGTGSGSQRTVPGTARPAEELSRRAVFCQIITGVILVDTG
jgi:hypothetical protein